MTTTWFNFRILALISLMKCLVCAEPNHVAINRTSGAATTRETEILRWNNGHIEFDDDEQDNVRTPEVSPSQHGIAVGNTWSPCFSLSRAHPWTRQCPQGACNILFENALVDGGNYDKKSGYFICPFPGFYFFTFSAISHAYDSFRLALFKNDFEVVSAYGAANGFDTSGNGIVLSLLTGDKISLKLLEGEVYESPKQFRAYTTFCGFLVFSAHSHAGRQPASKPDRNPAPESTGGMYPEAGPRILSSFEIYNISNPQDE